jgi:hypothetical protein
VYLHFLLVYCHKIYSKNFKGFIESPGIMVDSKQTPILQHAVLLRNCSIRNVRLALLHDETVPSVEVNGKKI